MEGKVLVRCHAGCEQERVISILRSRGLWPIGGQHYLTVVAGRDNTTNAKSNRDDDRRQEAALSIWRATKPADGTLVKTYLVSRGIHLPPPEALRFHPGLKHRSGGIWPAMIALVTRGADGTPLGIHRTFLARDGHGKAPIDPQKMMLGPCRGGAVRLVDPGDVLMVGEGIETCLAAMQASCHPAWAALSTSGLRNLDAPNGVNDLILLADGDDAGEAAAKECALRWMRSGRRVRIAHPPRGLDFNDMLMGRAACVDTSA
jgi:putative DNA primase/helicase